ncbi:sodium/glucose cotransporter 5-like [Xenia sp. Carnegie-2017]|uniref:sodium/glucose cotransporter 5-like n=1 Tax=Xenia sp. Carnegie-2017 TaxID=2897299 RepID=UPI001F05033B|nr:sodium/glucose cotransporter 5-like [Xenia sp. Carnegie-2017]XP_046859691.1 sodium/glucose cotransporter 5-like [Xenia sp. Carnegie-2017]
MASSFSWEDWLVVGLFFVITVSLGLLVKLRKRRSNKEETSEEFFLAGRNLSWWMVGGSLFASNMGGTHFVGIAGDGAATGIAVVAYEWQASWILLLLGYVFVPIYLKGGVYTMPEYLKNRYKSTAIQQFMTIMALISYVFTKISVDIYAGSLYFREATGTNIYISAVIILAITALYVILGGLEAVTYTDVLQCAIMLIGAIVLTVIGFNEIGGIDKLWEKFPQAVGAPYIANDTNNSAITNNSSNMSSCYAMTGYWANMFRPIDDPDYPWLGIWLSLPIIGIWYWCTDQVIVQRTLGSKSLAHAKGGTILAGFLKVLPMFIMVMPGMISRVLYADMIACPNAESCKIACDNEFGCTNRAYPKLVFELLPVGLTGLMTAVMVAAVMSSLSSVYNSCSTIFTVDVWSYFRPKAGDKEKVIVGRIVVLSMIGFGIVWLPFIDSGSGSRLFKYIQTIQALLGSPIMAVFLIGILWPRANGWGGLAGLVFGTVLGIARFATEYVFPPPKCGEIDDRPGFVSLNFMYFGVILFVGTVFVIVVISLLTAPIPVEEIAGLTWATIRKQKKQREVEPQLNHAAEDIELGSNYIVNGSINKVGGDSRDNNNGKICSGVTNGHTTNGHTTNGHANNGMGNVHVGNMKLSEFQVEATVEIDVDDVLLESKIEKILTNIGTVSLLATLAFLWIWYR